MIVVLALVALPTVYWTHGIERAAELRAAGIERVAVPSADAETWRRAGFTAVPLAADDLAAREKLLPPGIVARANVASPTRTPWASANGWRVLRNPAGRYLYQLPAGTASLAAAEAFAYGADVVIDPDGADVGDLGKMLAFLSSLPPSDLPGVADVAVVDDGSPEVGEVMNLLVRRNVLFRAVRGPAPDAAVNIQLGTAAYPRIDAADPSAFALKVRRELTDDRRSLRIYGSETVIGRLTADKDRARVHLLNYSRRELEGLRIRVRGSYPHAQAYLPERGAITVADLAVADGFTEFTLPAIGSYVVIDLGQR